MGNATPAVLEVPAIGAEWQGGLYAGLSLEDNRPVHLILLPGEADGKNGELNWKDAGVWAEKQGGTLPSRIDQLVLLKHLKAEFKADWYWSGEQHASYASYAWCQGFGYGGQLNYG